MMMSMLLGSKPRSLRMSITSYFWALLWLISNPYLPSRLRVRERLMKSLSKRGMDLRPFSLTELSKSNVTLARSCPHRMRSLSFFDRSV